MSTLWELVGDSTIDTRDLVTRVMEINEELAELEEERVGRDAPEVDDLRGERDILNELIDYIDGYSSDDCRFGITLVHDKYFEQYAQQFAEDIGAIDRDPKWPYEHIDWTAAAEALQMDYTSVDISTEEYWFR